MAEISIRAVFRRWAVNLLHSFPGLVRLRRVPAVETSVYVPNFSEPHKDLEYLPLLWLQ